MQRIPQVWPGWQAEELIGEGGFGKVYRASRTTGGHTSVAAIKVVDIPRSSAEVSDLRSMGMDALSIKEYFERSARGLFDEVALMDSLKGCPNVVHIEDYQLLERGDGVGWTVLIRMELLEPLSSVIERDGLPDQHGAAAIGADLCDALAACHERGVVHRDVKPSNVFRSPYGAYKLGDFGIARRLGESTRSSRSVAGTLPYMAPEVEGGRYDESVDTYSLGIMLYRWLNGGKPPFIGAGEVPTRDGLDRAQLRRMRGERPPLPGGEGVDPALAALVLRAVEPDPADRWPSAAEFGVALRAWLDASKPVRGEDIRADVEVTALGAKVGSARLVSFEFAGTGERASVTVSIPAGAEDGDEVVLSGMGERGANGGAAGDLVVPIHVVPDPNEPIRGKDVHAEVLVSEDEAREGVVRSVAFALPVAGRWSEVPVEVPAGIEDGAELCLNGLGDYAVGDGARGDLHVLVHVVGGRREHFSVGARRLPEVGGLPTIAVGRSHTVGLRPDGTVIAVGDNSFGECEVSEWRGIVAVAAGAYHTVGLCFDGTVLAAGANGVGQCNVSDWRDVAAIAAGWGNTVGLLPDGTVMATGNNAHGQCGVSGWRNVVAIAAGHAHTVGLLSDGTVLAAGANGAGQCNVSDWRDVVAVAAGYYHTVGLLSDGTVVATGHNGSGQCDVSDWRGVVSVAAGGVHTVGLLADGTAVAVGYNLGGRCEVSDWRSVVSITAGYVNTVGVLSDGTVVAAGDNERGQCDVSDWSGVVVSG